MLHTVNKSPFSSRIMDTALRFIKDGEPVLFFEDGVYAAQAGSSYEDTMKNLAKTNPVYVLDADVKARGLNKLISGIKVADYGKFVDLVAENKVYNWL